MSIGLKLFTLGTLSVLLMPGLVALVYAQPATPPQNPEFEALQAHFERVIDRRFDQLFSGITTVEDWEQRKQRTRQALMKMLWHDMTWPDAPPPATVTHRQEHDSYAIENLVLETIPGLFLTANLYLPREGSRPFPVVIYQCGHANKSYFVRHGAWFAAHGIAALVMDNIEMGEVEFTHHGVYSNAWFHWYSRGFSPLAVELLNARRAVDYLASRPDIDADRIGATGRSGGGMTTFYLAALDERVKASAPVSGTLSTRGWVKQRLTAAHCDCQFPVNSYGLLYSEIGALIAPRPQLLVNADADRGFPMDAFTEMAEKMRKAYGLYKSEGALQTAVTPGGHSDTEAIRLPVYSFFLREFLQKGPIDTEGPVEEPAAAELVCFRDGLPINERLTRIDETLIPSHSGEPTRKRSAADLAAALRNEVFRYFPEAAVPLAPEWSQTSIGQGRRVRKVTYASFEGLRVKGTLSLPSETSHGRKLPAVLLVDHRRGIPVWGNEQPLERNAWGDRAVLIVETLDRGSRALERNLRSFSDDDPLHHMKRQAMVAGTTLESMQVYEVLRSVELLRTVPEVDDSQITILGRHDMGVNGMYAALLDGKVSRVILDSPLASHRQGPHYLGILRYTDIPVTAELLKDKVRVTGEAPPEFGSLPRCGTRAECLR